MGRVLDRMARLLAWIGGALLVAMAGLTVVSVSGRALNWAGLGPVRGDFELVEAGTAVAVFLFLPLATLRGGHVRVTFALSALAPRGRAVFDLAGSVALAALAVLIAWRLWLGFGEKFPHGGAELRAAFGLGARPFYAETTYDLAMPVWYAYAPALVGAMGFALVALFCLWRGINDLVEGRAE